MRVVALNNDEDSYRIVLDKFIEDLLLDRHEANGELFSAFITNPTCRGT